MTRYTDGTRTKCPHCLTTVRLEAELGGQGLVRLKAAKEMLELLLAGCPSCGRLVMTIDAYESISGGYRQVVSERVIWPSTTGREPVPQEVPGHMARDYDEAAAVLPISAKASAALSRRCLQVVLREAAKTKSRDLSDQIEEVLASLPTWLREQLDAVRNIGNFAAHQQKSKDTGVILDVEPQEAEWNLDVLDGLFDFYFVRPAIAQQKRDALNAKLSTAGKPPMKQ